MKTKYDSLDIELVNVLDSLLAKDISITAQEVARNHPHLRHTSSFTRNAGRMKLITSAQERQKALRTTLNPNFGTSVSATEKLASAQADITLLESQIKALVASHAACILAVMKVGALPALELFWKEYKTIGETVSTVSAYPERAEVLTFKAPKKSKPRSDAS